MTSLVVLTGGALAAAADGADAGMAAAQPPRQQPQPIPPVDPCEPGSLLPACTLPPTTPTTTSPSLSSLPLPTQAPTLPPCDPSVPLQPCAPTGAPTSSTPCSGEGCIPQPGTSTPAPTNPDTGQPDTGETDGGDECGITDIGACVTEAIDGFFRGIVTYALNPLLDLLSKTLLTTPMPDSLPRVGELWDNSWQILLVFYGLLVLIAGVIVMGYQTLQTRYSVKEMAPRLVVGFLAGALSLWVATKGIQIANALVAAIMGGGIDANSAGDSLRNMVLGSLAGGLWIILIGLVLAAMLVALLITYVVRVALTIILIAGAPLALMFHALPQTEGLAYWWWRAYGGCLAIQVAQSLTLITAIKVFLAPGGFTVFGPSGSGLVNLLVAIALVYILFKIPFWVLSSIRGGGGRSLVGSLARGFLAYKAFGLFSGRGRSAGGGGTFRPPRTVRGASTNEDSSDPYARSRTTTDGQYLLPLAGLRRTRPPRTPAPGQPSAPNPSTRPRQLRLPLGDDWPENRPVLGRDGQYRLPLNVSRVTAPAPVSPGPVQCPGGTGRGRQLELPFDPYKGNRPTRSGQYPLPLDGLRRVPRPANAPPPSVPRTGRRVVQPELPFDPYKGNRPTRSGQFALPLDGVRRVPHATPPLSGTPSRTSRFAPRPGQQLRLPLDLPKPAAPRTKSRSKASASAPPAPKTADPSRRHGEG